MVLPNCHAMVCACSWLVACKVLRDVGNVVHSSVLIRPAIQLLAAVCIRVGCCIGPVCYTAVRQILSDLSAVAPKHVLVHHVINTCLKYHMADVT
mgnify:CR=1 FL=1